MADLRTALTEAMEEHRPEPVENTDKVEIVPRGNTEEVKIEAKTEAEKPRDEQGKFAQKQEEVKAEPVKIEKEINIEQPESKNIKIDEDDDWGAVPAFLRRSKIK